MLEQVPGILSVRYWLYLRSKNKPEINVLLPWPKIYISGWLYGSNSLDLSKGPEFVTKTYKWLFFNMAQLLMVDQGPWL